MVARNQKATAAFAHAQKRHRPDGKLHMYSIQIVGASAGSKWNNKDWNWEISNRAAACIYAGDLIRLLQADTTAPRQLVMAGFGWGDEARSIGELEILLYLDHEKLAA